MKNTEKRTGKFATLVLALGIIGVSIGHVQSDGNVDAYNQFGSSSGDTNQPETFQVSFEVAASGKEVKQDCAVCHWPQVHIGDRKLEWGETVTLRKGKSYDITVKDDPETRPSPPAGTTPPHENNAKFTVWPKAVNGQAITVSDDKKVFFVKKDEVLQYLIADPENMMATDKVWENEVLQKKATLLSVDLAVDANRDGVIKFGGNYNDSAVAENPQDTTSQDKPFRFWINDDDDGDSGGGEEKVDSTRKDFTDGIIKSTRDLEDFTRLHIYIGGLQDAIASGTIAVGLEWRNATGSPSIKVYQASETNGGDQYLKTELGAGNQAVGTLATALGTVANGGSFKLPTSFWGADSLSGRPAFSEDHPNRYLLFEGAAEGQGQLVLTFWKGNEKIGEGAGVWLDLKDIKKMYQRSQGDQFAGAPWNETDDTIIFVHGWRMSPGGRSSFAETFYKRLWHRGFKGRFAAFQWNTHYSDNWQWMPYVGGGIDAYLSEFNDSEHIAWQSAAGLKTFVAGLPGSKKHIAAHSMGNIVTSEAIRLGMSVKNYAMMQAAVPSACYDDNEGRIKQTTQTTHYGFTMWDNVTPDDDPDPETRALAYRGRFTHSNMTSVNMVSFFLPSDYATYIPWEVNNDQTKPEDGTLAANFRYLRNNASKQKLFKYTPAGPTTYAVDHYLVDPYEAMPFACHTWGKAQGAQNLAQGSIDDNIDLSSASFALPGETDPGFGDEHSGQFNARIQNLKPFYDAVLETFLINPNP